LKLKIHRHGEQTRDREKTIPEATCVCEKQEIIYSTQEGGDDGDDGDDDWIVKICAQVHGVDKWRWFVTAVNCASVSVSVVVIFVIFSSRGCRDLSVMMFWTFFSYCLVLFCHMMGDWI
jgi:hypothetical protein